MYKIFRIAKYIFALSLLLLLSACSSSTVDPGQNNFSFSTAVSKELNKVQSDSITITSAKILIRSLKMKTAGEDSADVKSEPFVVNLELDGTVNTISTNNLPTGTYNAAEFHIHRIEASGTPPDPEFGEGSERFSVIVRGFYHGQEFLYRSRKSAKQRVNLPAPIDIDNDGVENVTLIVNPHSWFYKDGMFLDPKDPANENDIDNLIKDSFRIVRDNNKDGSED
jgi:hypothetical protein